jgi:hypothetical protein
VDEPEIAVSHNRMTGMWFVTHAPACSPWRLTHTPVSADFGQWAAAVASCRGCGGTNQVGNERHREVFLSRAADIRAYCRCGYCEGTRKVTEDQRPVVALHGPEHRASYTSARQAYMETGSIADKEAMLSLVTADAPDLEGLGRDWEPTPARKRKRKPARTLSLALIMAGALEGAVQGITGSLPLAFSVIAFACVLIGWLLSRWDARRAART